MKILILSILIVAHCSTAAQDCSSSLLFKKGTELEYKSYYPKGLGNKFFEITRLVIKVEEVKDSNGTKYSYIKKTGTNPNNENLKYVKNYVINCDGNQISMPADFYAVDTIYFSNMYPTVKKDKDIYSSTVYKTDFFYNFPLDFTSNKFEAKGKDIVVEVTTRDYKMQKNMDNSNMGFSSKPKKGTREYTLSIQNIETMDKEKITTTAGSFDSFKIIFDTEYADMGLSYTTTLYYEPSIGLIKTETKMGRRKLAYSELVRVTGN